jgi:hypothetical protein
LTDDREKIRRTQTSHRYNRPQGSGFDGYMSGLSFKLIHTILEQMCNELGDEEVVTSPEATGRANCMDRCKCRARWADATYSFISLSVQVAGFCGSVNVTAVGPHCHVLGCFISTSPNQQIDPHSETDRSSRTTFHTRPTLSSPLLLGQ